MMGYERAILDVKFKFEMLVEEADNGKDDVSV